MSHSIVLVYGATCSGCGKELTAREFEAPRRKPIWPDWPIPCDEEFVRAELIHPVGGPWNGCGGRLTLVDPTRTDLTMTHLRSNSAMLAEPPQ